MKNKKVKQMMKDVISSCTWAIFNNGNKGYESILCYTFNNNGYKYLDRRVSVGIVSVKGCEVDK